MLSCLSAAGKTKQTFGSRVMRFERWSENLLREFGEDRWEIFSNSKFFSKKIIDEVIMENRSVCHQRDLDDENNKFKLKQFEFLYFLIFISATIINMYF